MLLRFRSRDIEGIASFGIKKNKEFDRTFLICNASAFELYGERLNLLALVGAWH